MKGLTDLHMHSTASDGQYTPEQLVERAAQAGVQVLALTDHDTTAGLEEAQQAALRAGVAFIPGIEMDTEYPGISGNFHILGYGIAPEDPTLLSLCRELAQQRSQRALRIFAYLEQRKMPVSPAAVEAYAGGAAIGRPHFARAMVDAGYVATMREAFDRVLDTPEFYAIDRKKPHPGKAIQEITAAGGLAVLAHPAQLHFGPEAPDWTSLLRELKDAGLKGLECYYSTFSPQETARYCALADMLGLYVTVGSDFHGEKIKPDIQLGTGIHGSLLKAPRELPILRELEAVSASKAQASAIGKT